MPEFPIFAIGALLSVLYTKLYFLRTVRKEVLKLSLPRKHHEGFIELRVLDRGVT